VLLLAIVLVSATAHTASADLGSAESAEIVELETGLDDVVLETAAPVLPVLVWLDSRTAHDAIPASPPLVQVFRPPRRAS